MIHSISISAAEIEAFKIEATDLLVLAEQQLLCLESGGEFEKTYATVFRVLQSLKGGAGMMQMTDLEAHMHALESLFSNLKNRTTLEADELNYIFRDLDAANQILTGRAVSSEHHTALPTTRPLPQSLEKPKGLKSVAKPLVEPAVAESAEATIDHSMYPRLISRLSWSEAYDTGHAAIDSSSA